MVEATGQVNITEHVAKAMAFHEEGRQLDAVLLFKEIEAAVAAGTCVDASGNKVTADSQEYKNLIATEAFQFLTEHYAVIDYAREKLAECHEWKSTPITDKALPEWVNLVSYYKPEKDGISVATEHNLKWTMAETAAIFQEGDLSDRFFQVNDRQTFELVANPKKNIVSV